VNVLAIMGAIKRLLLLVSFVNISISAYSQIVSLSDSIPILTLGQCVNYAMQHQPALNRAFINRSIVRTTNAINLSGWLPQVSISGNLTHYIQLPSAFASNQSGTGTPAQTRSTFVNTFVPELSVSQTIFNPQLLYAARISPLYSEQAEQIIDSSKINIVTSVSKSFYNLLLTLEQVNILKEDTTRLGRSIVDAYKQYIGGIVDETDNEQAIITFNNSKAQLFQQIENIGSAYANLKQIMGYPPEKHFNVTFDTAKMMQEIAFDTVPLLQYEKRIEYQQLQTVRKLQHQLTTYHTLSILPTISAFYNYNYEYASNTASTLFSNAYPYSYVGLSLNIPLFTGFSRMENIHKSKLQEQDIDWAEIGLKSEIYSEYTTTLANYRSNRYNWHLLKENEMRAKNVYNIILLQYQQGIVPYLNLIVAESNLITAEIGYSNALFQLLFSKIDLEKAIGIIPYH